MKRSFVFIAVINIILFSACHSSDKYAAEIKLLDSLSLLLDSAEIRYHAIDTLKISRYKQEIETNMDFIEKNNSDTLNRDIAFVLSDYSLLRDPLKKINEECAEMGKELEESKEQIESLIHDFKINKVDGEKAALYLQDERIAAERVIRNVEVITRIAKSNLETFEANNPKVLEFIETVKSKQAGVK